MRFLKAASARLAAINLPHRSWRVISEHKPSSGRADLRLLARAQMQDRPFTHYDAISRQLSARAVRDEQLKHRDHRHVAGPLEVVGGHGPALPRLGGWC
jgi:hypothetical protein